MWRIDTKNDGLEMYIYLFLQKWLHFGWLCWISERYIEMILPLERDAFHGTVQVEMKNQTFRRLANLVISPGSFEKKMVDPTIT